MRTKITLLATTTLVTLAIAAPAQAAGSGWYVSAMGGANWVDDNDFFVNPVAATTLTWMTEADTGWLVAGAVGLGLGNVWSGLRAEVEVGYRENNVDGAFRSNLGGPTPFQSGTVDYDHQTFSILANVWLDIPIGSGFTGYVGGGLGWADTSFDGAYTCTLSCVGVIPFDFSDDGFAWQAGTGVNFQVSPNMQLGVGYRYFQGPEPTAIGPLLSPTTATELDNHNHSAVVTLSFGM
jgi:OOP family OmpA-OmpF porin